VTIPKTVVASTVDTLIILAEQFVGLAYVPFSTVRRQIEARILETVLDLYVRNSRPFRIMWPAKRHGSRKSRHLSRISRRIFSVSSDVGFQLREATKGVRPSFRQPFGLRLLSPP